MKVKFNDKTYEKNKRNGGALKNLCFDIFKQYLEKNNNLTYSDIQNTFNQWHCNNNFVVLSVEDWQNKTENLRGRYFEPIEYNGLKLYFSTQWGNNGADCDNINKMMKFAKAEKYDIEVIEEDSNISFSWVNEANSNINIKNIILYGSPGVGKTHNHKKIIALIEGRDFNEKEIFNFIINNIEDDIRKGSVEEFYTTIVNEERMKFVTFHQSFGYEDFIEGFRPNEEGDIKLVNGIFKSICIEAQKNIDNSLKAEVDISEEKKFEILFELFKDYIQDEIDANQKFIINNTAYITDIEENAFRYQGDNWGNTQRMKFDDIGLLYSKNISERIDIKNVVGISGLGKQHATYFSYFMKKLLVFESKQDIEITTIEKVERKNYYLVIDEINRGNISKIFGELITLIEEDKRDTLEVTLPYSKQTFRIPSNLYIIGTMNSTDKSIALIDIALRRRFTFLRMEPKPDLVNHDKAQNIMIQINEKITNALGADYVLGHSYFMKIENDDDLDFVLEYKVIPLLEEYYYGDENGLNDVLKICNVNNMVVDDNE